MEVSNILSIESQTPPITRLRKMLAESKMRFGDLLETGDSGVAGLLEINDDSPNSEDGKCSGEVVDIPGVVTNMEKLAVSLENSECSASVRRIAPFIKGDGDDSLSEIKLEGLMEAVSNQREVISKGQSFSMEEIGKPVDVGLSSNNEETSKLLYTNLGKTPILENTQPVLNLPKDLCREIYDIGMAEPIAGERGATKPNMSWKNIVTGEASSKMPKVTPFASARSVVDLQFYPNDSDIVELTPDKVEIERWGNYLVGHFVGAKVQFYEVEKELRKQWVGLESVICTDKGIYMLEFSNLSTMYEILETGMCFVYGRVMVVKKWHQMLQMTKEAVEKIPIWVRLYASPLEFWSVENMSRVASKLGKPLYMDRTTENKNRLSYARICVEIEASQELRESIKVRSGEKIVEVAVMYQWLPFRCGVCNVFGHRQGECSKEQGQGKKQEFKRENNLRPPRSNLRYNNVQGPSNYCPRPHLQLIYLLLSFPLIEKQEIIMKYTPSIALCSILAILLLLSYGADMAVAVTCKPTELSPCLAAMQSSRTPPSKLCCFKIREQKPCLCQYVKNPYLKKFVKSPNAMKISTTCNAPFPKC